jgi:dTDP-4-dehydrorhamnose reductase
VVFNCAGYTNVDRCESEPDLARAVNGEGPGHLACAARDAGAVLLHVSTDFVFDGERRAPYVEDDAPNPLSVYGRSKLAGDRGVAAAGGRWVIARTAWLYGRNGRNFVDTMLRLAREGKDLSVVTDRVGSPTWTRDLAGAIVALIRADARGIYNAVNRGACSRYEQVLEIVRLAGLAVRVNPVDSRAFPRPAATPAYSALDVSRLARDTGHVMRPWQQALRDYLTHVP